MEPMATSLGQLAVAQQLISDEQRVQLTGELRQGVRDGAPLSLAQLLIKAGFPQDVVSTVLASGLALEGVCCDACGAATPQEELTERREYPCPRCGSLLLGFAAFADGSSALSAAGAPPSAEEQPPGSNPRLRGTDRFEQVLDLPEKRERGTLRYDRVHELPAGEELAPAGGNDTTSPFGIVFRLPEPPKPPGKTPTAKEATDRFKRMLVEPSPVPSEWSEGSGGGLTLSPEELQALKGEPEEDLGGRTLSPSELEELRASQGEVPVLSEAITPDAAQLTAAKDQALAMRGYSPAGEGELQASEAVTLDATQLTAAKDQALELRAAQQQTEPTAPASSLVPLVAVLLCLLLGIAAGLVLLVRGL